EADAGLLGLAQNCGAGCARLREVRLDVVDLDEASVDNPWIVVRTARRLRLAAESQRIRIAARRGEEDPRPLELELGVRDDAAALEAGVTVFAEADCALQPLDRAGRVLVADERHEALAHVSTCPRPRSRASRAGRAGSVPRGLRPPAGGRT